MHTNLHNRPLDLFDLVENILSKPTNIKKQASLLAVDVIESTNQFLVSADLPGISKENIKIEFDKGNLSILADARPTIEKQEGDKVILNERQFSKLSRTLRFGENVDSEGIKASYKDGVLTLVIPKREAPVSLKHITIE